MPVHVFRLKPGVDLKNAIQHFAEEQNITAGWVITCVGSLTHTNLRYANQSGGIPGTGHFEIISLCGTVSVNGSHLHMAVSNENGETVGGHLLDGNIIYTTAEIVIGYDPELIFSREPDGLYKELVVRRNG